MISKGCQSKSQLKAIRHSISPNVLALLAQPPTVGTIFPVMRTNPTQNTQNHNKRSRNHPNNQNKHPSRSKNPRRNPRKNRPTLYPSTPRRSLEGEISPTSRPSREALRLRSSKRRSSISIQSRTPLPSAMTQILKVNPNTRKNPSLKKSKPKLRRLCNRSRRATKRSKRNQKSSKKRSSCRPFSRR